MLGIRVSVQGGDQFRRADGPGAVRVISGALTRRMAARLLAVATPLVPVDTENLQKGGTVTQNGETGAGVLYPAEYGPFVHGPIDGSGRGQRTEPHWPPWGEGSALAGWAERHGVSAFLVARAIAKNGTPYVPFLADAWDSMQGNDVPQLKADARRELQELLLKGG